MHTSFGACLHFGGTDQSTDAMCRKEPFIHDKSYDASCFEYKDIIWRIRYRHVSQATFKYESENISGILNFIVHNLEFIRKSSFFEEVKEEHLVF